MKKSRSILITLVLLLVIVLPMTLVGCNKPTEQGNDFVDLAGEPINVTGPVDRIACIGTGALRMITYAGLQDKLVCIERTDTLKVSDDDKQGRTEKDLIKKPYAYVNREAFTNLAKENKISSKGGGPNPVVDPVVLASFNPQVVFCTYNDEQALSKLRNDLAAFNIPLVKIFIDTDIAHPVARENIRKSFEIIGKIGGVEERCAEIVKMIDDTFDDLDKRTKDIKKDERPTAYVGAISYRGNHGLDWTYANFSCLQAINTKGIVDNLGGDQGKIPAGAYPISLEYVVKQNPTYVFVDISNWGSVKGMSDQAKNAIKQIPAVKNSNAEKSYVHSIISYNYYSTNIEYALANAYYMGKVMYPEQFSDVDIIKKVNELTTFFDGAELYEDMKKYDLTFGAVNLNEI